MDSVEGIVLLKTDEDARRIMDGMCPDKCVCAYTMSGGMARGRNRKGEGFYRFYACQRARKTTFLSDQAFNMDTVSMKAELSRLEDENSKLQDDINKAASELTSLQRKHSKAAQSYVTTEAERNGLRSQYRSLERRFEQLQMEDDHSVVETVRLSLDEINAQIGELDDELVKLNEDVSQKKKKVLDLRKELGELDSKLNEAKSNVELLQNELEDANERIRHLDDASESNLKHQERIRGHLAKIDTEMEELELKRVEASKTADRSKELPTPSSMSFPPDMKQLDDTAELDEKYKALTLRIAAAENVSGNVVASEELQSYKEKYEEAMRQYLVLRALNKKLSEFISIRKERFPIICHAITMRLKKTFQNLMATRRYDGNLIVDRQKELINITVATHQRDQSSHPATKSVVQDLKGLSGGERSFTTACFIMALWEIMEAPFRCMDEFDVFMDMINRRVIMELLVKLATEQYSHNQFIFFTPQGIKELGEREHVQVFEMPKVRE
ncbi:Structural maintenance of chromosomes protein 6 [Parelaphostrongylus tenuis]|uniref:Structural maintenance of chromosomes protein 6 n=1 Tax=Parelaphostrongylus tenuis TaxID=148309 RepID=A0AAD5LVW7_PARTN|nr:Structural maintenance of chromosomes protein 6 [Parelaphostrongylus tenuis]